MENQHTWLLTTVFSGLNLMNIPQCVEKRTRTHGGLIGKGSDRLPRSIGHSLWDRPVACPTSNLVAAPAAATRGLRGRKVLARELVGARRCIVHKHRLDDRHLLHVRLLDAVVDIHI